MSPLTSVMSTTLALEMGVEFLQLLLLLLPAEDSDVCCDDNGDATRSRVVVI